MRNGNIQVVDFTEYSLYALQHGGNTGDNDTYWNKDKVSLFNGRVDVRREEEIDSSTGVHHFLQTRLQKKYKTCGWTTF